MKHGGGCGRRIRYDTDMKTWENQKKWDTGMRDTTTKLFMYLCM